MRRAVLLRGAQEKQDKTLNTAELRNRRKGLLYSLRGVEKERDGGKREVSAEDPKEFRTNPHRVLLGILIDTAVWR